MADYDLAIIGGGINGVGIARDAAGRGLRVVLLEQSDLASGTSSASTKLIHGGLRYLEHGAIRLVREALREREVLLQLAPHIVRPLRFVLPADPGPRSPTLLRIGLFLYDHLGGRKILPATRTVDLAHSELGAPLKRRYLSGFEYSDCWVDDARLVVLNAMDAHERGASIRTGTRVTRVERGEEWKLILNAEGRREVVTARALVNAAGPWAGIVAESVLRTPGPAPVRLVKGSHIVVPKLFDHDRGYIFQNQDNRIVFALPFQNDYTMIGTTDLNFVGDLATPVPSTQEIDYLRRAVGAYFREEIGDTVWAFAGVRALYDDREGKPEDITREYHLELNRQFGEAPLLTVYGGKITTYRKLAESALAQLAPFFRLHDPWTARAPLPGGDFLWDGVEARVAQALRSWPFLAPAEARRLVSAYGTRLDRVLGVAESAEDLGPRFGPISAVEVLYLVRNEWARTVDDVIWRRSKLGLRMTKDEIASLDRFIAGAVAPSTANDEIPAGETSA
jgi:glycerol-3-phosphate dehydrogenase